MKSFFHQTRTQADNSVDGYSSRLRRFTTPSSTPHAQMMASWRPHAPGLTQETKQYLGQVTLHHYSGQTTTSSRVGCDRPKPPVSRPVLPGRSSPVGAPEISVYRSRGMFVAAAQLPLPASQLRRRDSLHPPKVLAAILRSRVIACLRAQDGETARQAAHAAVCGGVSVLEIVMSTPGALEVLEDLRRSYPSLTFGVGTVLNADDAKKAIRAGAQFLMSPGTVTEILRDLEESEVLYIPGVLTPTEVISARDAGAEVVKVYPVSVMDGERYMSALKKPFPLLPMVASQGIAIGSIKSYMEAGASAVVLSDAIFDKELMGNREFIGISALANQATVEASQSGR